MPEKLVNVNGYNEPEEALKNGKIRVKLICPLFPEVTMEADSVLLPALGGDILILPDRAPIFCSLRPGRMIVYNKGEIPVSFLVSSGICEIRRNLCPVLAWGGREDKINAEMIGQYLKMALRAFPDYKSDIAKTEAASRIAFFKMVLEKLHYNEKTAESFDKKKKILRLKDVLGI